MNIKLVLLRSGEDVVTVLSEMVVTNPDGSIAPTRAKHFKVLLHRFMLNELLLKGGGTLFSQKFSRPAPRPFTHRTFTAPVTGRPQPVYSPI